MPSGAGSPKTVDLKIAAAERVGALWEMTLPERRRNAQTWLDDVLADRYALAVPRIALTPIEIVAIDEDWPIGLRARAQAAASGCAPVEIAIRLRKTAAGWQIADVILEGVSVLCQTMREIGAPRPTTGAVIGPSDRSENQTGTACRP